MKKDLIYKIIIVVLHSVAILSFFLGLSDLVLPLSSLNLLITSILLILSHKEKNVYYLVIFLMVYICSFLIELIGVKTGLFFGVYTYMDNLGPKLFDTPLVIGLNWWIMVICSASIINKTRFSPVLKVVLSAALMVGMDILIEPLAPVLGYWSWEIGYAPLKNYIAWFMVGFAFQIMYWRSPYDKNNSLAEFTYYVLFSFFLVLNIIQYFNI